MGSFFASDVIRLLPPIRRIYRLRYIMSVDDDDEENDVRRPSPFPLLFPTPSSLLSVNNSTSVP